MRTGNTISVSNQNIWSNARLGNFYSRVRADGGTLLNYDTTQGLYSGLPALVRSDASMVMLPCGYKSGKVYGLNGNDFTFSRASNATRVNENGLIELVSSNIPRFQFDPVTKQYQGVLLEKASTNLLTWSEDFSNAVWQKPSIIVSTNATNAPDGTLTADKFQEITGSSGKFLYQNISVTAGLSYTASVYVKAGERSWFYCGLTSTGFTAAYRTFNAATGAYGTTQGAGSFTVKNMGNGWYLISTTATANVTSTTARLEIAVLNGDNISAYTGDGLSGGYVWGAQFEQSSVPTSYMPATSASATRTADSLFIATGSWFVSSEGTLYADYSSFGSVTTNRIFSLNDGTVNNSIHADLSSFSVINGGVSQAAIGSTGASGKIAGAYKANDFAFSKNGGAVATDSSGTIPTVNTLKIGAASSAGSELNGTIKALAYFPTRRTNSELQTITT